MDMISLLSKNRDPITKISLNLMFLNHFSRNVDDNKFSLFEMGYFPNF